MNKKPDVVNENINDKMNNISYLSYVMRARLKIGDRYKQVKSYYSRKMLLPG